MAATYARFSCNRAISQLFSIGLASVLETKRQRSCRHACLSAEGMMPSLSYALSYNQSPAAIAGADYPGVRTVKFCRHIGQLKGSLTNKRGSKSSRT